MMLMMIMMILSQQQAGVGWGPLARPPSLPACLPPPPAWRLLSSSSCLLLSLLGQPAPYSQPLSPPHPSVLISQSVSQSTSRFIDRSVSQSVLLAIAQSCWRAGHEAQCSCSAANSPGAMALLRPSSPSTARHARSSAALACRSSLPLLAPEEAGASRRHTMGTTCLMRKKRTTTGSSTRASVQPTGSC